MSTASTSTMASRSTGWNVSVMALRPRMAPALAAWTWAAWMWADSTCREIPYPIGAEEIKSAKHPTGRNGHGKRTAPREDRAQGHGAERFRRHAGGLFCRLWARRRIRLEDVPRHAIELEG